MTTKDAVKLVEKAGTKIGKDKLIEALRHASAKDLHCAMDSSTGYSLVLVKLTNR
jgi:hypothetical protein